MGPWTRHFLRDRWDEKTAFLANSLFTTSVVSPATFIIIIILHNHHHIVKAKEMGDRILLLAVTSDDYNPHHQQFGLNVDHTARSAAPTSDPCFNFRINLAESWKPRFA